MLLIGLESSLSLLGLSSLFFGLELGGMSFPWHSGKVVSLIVFGTVAAVLFAVVEKLVAKLPTVPCGFSNRRPISQVSESVSSMVSRSSLRTIIFRFIFKQFLV